MFIRKDWKKKTLIISLVFIRNKGRKDRVRRDKYLSSQDGGGRKEGISEKGGRNEYGSNGMSIATMVV